ncbi:DUF4397 domain-containing protein [Natronorubrum halophilum]|uniref:DUF4397 domain-containing protein n=1 Tax=Natronorubrum halophilum TaxID=1702106 RepID=UPI0010C23D27|nr:DUF4397 domain-containing protein [Natronorubrum halophilum]
MTLSRRSTIKAIGVVGTGSALTGTALAVSEHEDDERDPEEASGDEMGAIRVGHFAPDAPNVDVYVDDQQVLADLAYDELTPYLEIAPGTYTLKITAAGDEATVYEDTLPVDTGYYTAAAIGELETDETADDGTVDEGAEEPETAASIQYDENDTDNATVNDTDNATVNDTDNATVSDEDDATVSDDVEEDQPEMGTFEVLLLYDEGPDYIEEPGTSQLRLVHASPDAPPVDVTDSDMGLPIFEDVAFGEPSGYTPVEPGAQTLELFPAGEIDFGAGVENGTQNGNVSDTEPEEPETAASVQEENDTGLNETENETDTGLNETENETDTGLDDGGQDDQVIDRPDPVASAEIDLEEDMSYTAFAIGYLEQVDDTAGDRPFEIRVAVDGMEEDDEDDAYADDGNYTDDGNHTDDHADGGNYTNDSHSDGGNHSDHHTEESASADD